MYEVRTFTLSDWQVRMWERAVDLAFKRGEAESRPLGEIVSDLNTLYEHFFARKEGELRPAFYPGMVALTASIKGNS